VVFLGSTVAVLVVLLARNGYLFGARVYEDGDFALNSLLVQRAERLQLLVGNYSRAGFHHPGPALLYMLAAGQAAFHDLLPVVPAPYNGQVLGDLVFVAAVLGWIAVIVHRVTGSRLAAGAALAVSLWFAGEHRMAGDIWFPYLYLTLFVLLLVAAAAIAAGRTAELPALVLAGGLLVHGHVSFALFVAGTAAAAGAGWWLTRRRGWRDELRAHRRRLQVAFGLAGLVLLPMVVQTALHFPGPWPDYLRYTSEREPGGHPLGAAVRFLGWYWSPAQVPLVLTGLAAAAGAVLLCTDRVPARRRFFAALYGVLALESVLFLIYLVRGVDELIPKNRYVGFFYLGVPLLLLVAAAAQLAARVPEVGHAFPVAVAATAVAVFAVGATRPGLSSDYRGSPSYPDAVAALAGSPERAGAPIALRFAHDDWPLAAGLVVAGTRRGVPVCVEDPRWTNLFTSRHICPAQAPRRQVRVVRGGTPPAGSRVLWRGSDLVVVT
jgi:hypothetical protein